MKILTKLTHIIFDLLSLLLVQSRYARVHVLYISMQYVNPYKCTITQPYVHVCTDELLHIAVIRFIHSYVAHCLCCASDVLVRELK